MSIETTIVLIENAYLLRSGLENLLKEVPGIRLLEIFDGSEKHLPDKINRLKPDLVIVNPIALEDHLSSLLSSLSRKTILIGLTDKHTTAIVRSKFSYIIDTKDTKFGLLESLNKVPGIRRTDHKNKEKNQSLTEREITILKHVTLGMTNQEIAGKLFLSVHTVTTHRKNITKKLGIKTVSGLTVYALLNQIIRMDEIKK